MKTAWIAVLFAAACGSSDAPAPKAEPAPRSGKIDLPGTAPGSASGMRDGRIPRRERDGKRDDRITRSDTDGDGQVSDEERAARMERRAAEMKARLDTNSDGVVSEEETAANRRDRAENMYGRLDKDGDGKLTPAELSESRMRRFDPATADANKDGNITVEELETAMKNAQPGPWGGRRRPRPDGAPGGSGSE